MFLTPTHIAIVMEYARGGDLLRYTLKHYPAPQQEDQARWIFQQLVIGLDYCHKMVSWLSMETAVNHSSLRMGKDGDAPSGWMWMQG